MFRLSSARDVVTIQLFAAISCILLAASAVLGERCNGLNTQVIADHRSIRTKTVCWETKRQRGLFLRDLPGQISNQHTTYISYVAVT